MNYAKISKILMLASGVILILLGVPRVVLNAWLPMSDYLFYFALVLFLFSLAINYKKILEVLCMRTTKYGLNMGTLLFLGVLLFLSLNFLSTRYDKSFDVTSDQLNSLSLQTTDILSKLDTSISFKVYYQGDLQSNNNIALKLLFKKYQQESDKISYVFLDAYKDPSSSQFLTREDKGKIVTFVKMGARSERVRDPISEESLTSAIYRLQKTNKKVIYFLEGHGERSLTSDPSGSGIKLLNEALIEKGFSTKSLNLLEMQGVPKDAAMLAWVGPKKSLLEPEFKMVKLYIQEGGRFLLALDPSANVEVNSLLKPLGVTYQKNFLLTTTPIAGADELAILGGNFSQESDITKDLGESAIALFYEASDLSVEQNDFDIKEIVKTTPTTIPVSNLQNYRKEMQTKKIGLSSLAVSVEGKVDHESHNHDSGFKFEEEEEHFKVLTFGDSDFLSDLYFETGFNKDIALNAFADLSGETGLVSIRPKVASSTKLILTITHQSFLLIFPILIPLILLIVSAVLWFRRRGA